ncbi:MAG: phosphatase PAP2 family protein [Tepidiformaceae bacterium]
MSAALFGASALALSLWVASAGAPLPGDLWLTIRIQDADSFAGTARVANAAGGWAWQWPVVGLMAALVAWAPRGERRARAEALWALAALVVLRYWDQVMKAAVQSPRPVEALDVEVDRVRDTYGFPSGHVYSDVLVYGLVAVFATVVFGRRLGLVARTVAIAVIVLAGPARVYVGAHWPSDTVGGYLWGLAALCLAVAFGRWLAGSGWRRART